LQFYRFKFGKVQEEIGMKSAAVKSALFFTVSAMFFPLGASAENLSFDDLRVSCTNPAKFHNQIAPSNIQVTCKDVQTKWVADSNGTLTVPGAREVVTTIASDKYASPAAPGTVKVPDQALVCPKFKEVQETVENVRAVTCNDLVAFTGNVTEFCSGTVDALRASNPDAVKTTDTGRVLDLCANTAPKPVGQAGQSGQPVQ
jgi:hypothetical protein